MADRINIDEALAILRAAKAYADAMSMVELAYVALENGIDEAIEVLTRDEVKDDA